MHTADDLKRAARQSGLWDKLFDSSACHFHIGDRVHLEGVGTGTVIGNDLPAPNISITVLGDDGNIYRGVNIHLSSGSSVRGLGINVVGDDVLEKLAAIENEREHIVPGGEDTHEIQ